MEQILDAGIELGDHEGVEAGALSRVADRLGLTTNALYRHLGSRDELRQLVYDRALGRPPRRLGLDADQSWRDAVRRWALALRRRYREHPWLHDVVVRVPTAPGALGWLDPLLAMLDRAGLDQPARLRAAALLDGFVRNAAAVERDVGDQGPPLEVDLLLELVRGAGLLEVAAVIEAGDYAAAPPGTDFEFGLEVLLDGLEASRPGT